MIQTFIVCGACERAACSDCVRPCDCEHTPIERIEHLDVLRDQDDDRRVDEAMER